MSFEQPTAAEYAWAAAEDARRIAEQAREEARRRPVEQAFTPGADIRADLGFSAYGSIITSVSGRSDPLHSSIAVGAIHQATTLPVCTRCGAAVPIPYQERHAEWHAFVESKIGAEPDEEVRS